MSGRLAQRHVLITGAGGGIGLAIARACLAEGAVCTLADRADTPSDGVAQLRRRHPDAAAYVAADVSDSASVGGMLYAARAAHGDIHTLVNNAALFDMAPLLESDAASFDRLFAVNVKGMFFLMQAVAKRMVEQGRGGKIINMSSQAGRRGEALVSHYCATKAAVISYTQSAALALARERINVNGIAPGVVDTPMWNEVDALFARYENRPLGEKKRLVGEEVPLGRMGVPADLTGAALFLASSDSDYITAQTINVDGGNWMS